MTDWAVDSAEAAISATPTAKLAAISAVSNGAGAASATRSATASNMPEPAGAKIRPGLVQNWPAPRVNDATNPAAIASVSAAAAAAVTNTGLTVPISANTGTPRSAARASNAIPPRWLPVKATAAMAGASTTWSPASNPVTRSYAPSGAPAARSADRATIDSRTLSRGCAGWAFAMTGHPAANAEATS